MSNFFNIIWEYITSINLYDIYTYIGSITWGSILDYLNGLGLQELLNTLKTINSYSLNSIWSSTGVTEFSILFCLKVAFFIVFFSINVYLFYLEYLESTKINNHASHMKGGMIPDYKRIASELAIGLGFIGSMIAIKNEYMSHNERKILQEKAKAAMEKADYEARQMEAQQKAINFHNRLHITSIRNSYVDYLKAESEETDLQRLIKENSSKVDWGTNNKDQYQYKLNLKLYETQLQAATLKKIKAKTDLDQNITTAHRYTELIAKSTETDETKFLADINKKDDGIHKSSMLNLDELWTRFEAFDGVTKLACVMMLSGSVVLTCIFSIAVNIYGNYLLDRFKLEDKYPKIAIFIKYRQKVSKYYIISNMTYIVSMCLMNLYFGASIIGII